MYASLLGISEALDPGVFEQPVNRVFFTTVFASSFGE
jgi:hypothetical protein